MMNFIEVSIFLLLIICFHPITDIFFSFTSDSKPMFHDVQGLRKWFSDIPSIASLSQRNNTLEILIAR